MDTTKTGQAGGVLTEETRKHFDPLLETGKIQFRDGIYKDYIEFSWLTPDSRGEEIPLYHLYDPHTGTVAIEGYGGIELTNQFRLWLEEKWQSHLLSRRGKERS